MCRRPQRQAAGRGSMPSPCVRGRAHTLQKVAIRRLIRRLAWCCTLMQSALSTANMTTCYSPMYTPRAISATRACPAATSSEAGCSRRPVHSSALPALKYALSYTSASRRSKHNAGQSWPGAGRASVSVTGKRALGRARPVTGCRRRGLQRWHASAAACPTHARRCHACPSPPRCFGRQRAVRVPSSPAPTAAPQQGSAMQAAPCRRRGKPGVDRASFTPPCCCHRRPQRRLRRPRRPQLRRRRARRRRRRRRAQRRRRPGPQPPRPPQRRAGPGRARRRRPALPAPAPAAARRATWTGSRASAPRRRGSATSPARRPQCQRRRRPPNGYARTRPRSASAALRSAEQHGAYAAGA